MDDPLLALLPKARRRWARTDPILARASREAPLQERALSATTPFHALTESISHQQVSLAAGRAIFARVVDACGGAVTPEDALRAGPEALRSAGLSRPKVGYVLDLATRARSGEVALDRVAAMGDEEIVEMLTRVKGIGTWTAKMFLLFHLSRPDVHASEDLGLQIAVARLYDVPRETAKRAMEAKRADWAPFNSLAALTLWGWRRDHETLN